MVVHGGFWRRRYGRHLMDAVCADLAARGWAAWNLEYRRVGPRAGGRWPATLEDVAAGIDALTGPIARGVVPPAPVVAIGHSAGGQLALWAAARSGLPDGSAGARPAVRITHAVGQAAVADLALADRLGLGGGAAARMLGAPAARVPDRVAHASPIERLPLGVPQLLVHGARDDTVPLAMSERYVEAARVAGDRAELVAVPDAGHDDHLDPRSACWAAVTRWLPGP